MLEQVFEHISNDVKISFFSLPKKAAIDTIAVKTEWGYQPSLRDRISVRQAKAFGMQESYDASCPSWTSLSWCAGYKGGYFKEWAALREAQ